MGDHLHSTLAGLPTHFHQVSRAPAISPSAEEEMRSALQRIDMLARGEQPHAGYYAEPRGPRALFSGFRSAQRKLLESLLDWSGLDAKIAAAAPGQLRVLDVGCGVGGTSRFLAEKVGSTGSVTGVTSDAAEAARGARLCAEEGVDNCEVRAMDPLSLSFPDGTFDIVWAMEGFDELPASDKLRYIEEMTRVLKPGGQILMASWCKRAEEFDFGDWGALDFLASPSLEGAAELRGALYTTQPHLVSIQDYRNMFQGTNEFSSVQSTDLSEETLPSWRHAMVPALLRPATLRSPLGAWRALRKTERVRNAFNRGFLQYGVLCATKQSAFYWL